MKKKKKCDYSIKEKDIPKKPINIKSLPKLFSKKIVKKYLSYRKCRWGVKDHGIYGGVKYFDFMCKLRKDKEHSNSKLYWGYEMIEIYRYIAWIIICHNIFTIHPNDEYERCYNCKKIKTLILDEGEKLINLEDHPLLFLFCLVDSIDPLKDKSVDYLKKIRLDFQQNTILLNFEGLATQDAKDKYIKQIEGLEKWLDVTVEKNNETISTLIPQHYYKYNFLST